MNKNNTQNKPQIVEMLEKTPQTRVLFPRCQKRVGLLVFGTFLLLPLLTMFFSMSHPRLASAVTSSYLNFQARLMTASGAIVPDGNYNVEFKLYNTATVTGTPDQGACTRNGGTTEPACLWTETRTSGNVVQVKNGYLTVNLGSVTALPNIDYSQQLWLTMRIGGTGAPSWDPEMNPRLQLTAVPYAFKAGDSATLGGIASSGFIQNTTSPQSANAYVQAASSGSVAGILRANAAGTGDILQLKNGGGTSVATFGSSGSVLFKPSTDSATALQIQPSGSTTPVLNIDTSNSRIGIGTAAPSRTFDVAVNNTQVAAPMALLEQAGTGDAALELKNSGAGSSFYLSNDASNGNALTLNSNAAATTSAPLTVAHVQSTSANNNTSTSNISLAFGSNNTAGNLIVVAVGFDNTNTSTVTCTDTRGNTYAQAFVAVDNTLHDALVVCYAANVAAGANTVTATFGGVSNGTHVISVHEYSGVAASSPLDATVTNLASGSTVTDNVTSGSVMTNQNGDLIFGVVTPTTGSSSITAGTGFTQRATQISLFASQDRVQSSAGSMASTNTFGTARTYLSGLAAFKANTTSGTLTDTNTNAIFTLSAAGALKLQGTANSAQALQVNNFGGVALLTADTQNSSLIIKSPTNNANALQVQNSGGTTVFNVNTVTNTTVINGAAGQTGDLFQIKDSTGANITRKDANANEESLGYFNNGIGGIGQFGNLLTYSEQFDNAAWTKTNVTAPTADTQVGVDGRTNAESLADSASGGSASQTSATAPTNANYTFSVWLKAPSGTQSVDLRVDGATSGTGTKTTVTATTTWQRFSVTQNTNGFTGNIKVLIFPGTTAASGTIHAWGGQLVLASNPLVYVRTTTGSVAASWGAVSNGGVYISSIDSNDVPLIIQGAVGQTGDLIQLQTASGQVSGGFSSSGQFYLGQANVTNSSLALFNSSNSNTVTIQSGITSANYTLTLPTVVGATGDCLKTTNGTGTLTFGSCGAAGSGVNTIGTIDSQTKATNGAVISGSNIYLQTADATNPGLVSTGAQTFAGAKTISNTAANGNSLIVSSTASSATGTNTVIGTAINLGGTINPIGSNTITGLDFGTVTAAMNNNFYGINFGTGFNDLLRYNGTQLVSGTGLAQNAVFDASLTYTNLAKVGNVSTGSITSTGAASISPTANSAVALTVNATTGTSAVGAIFNQSQAADGLQINSNSTTGTQTNGVSYTQNGAGTTTNGVSITQAAGTLTNGLDFNGTIATDINRDTGTLVIQGAGGISLTSSGGNIQIGSATTNATATLLVLDSYNQATDPTGTNGGMYYSTSKNAFRCYENGAWKNCLDGTQDTQSTVFGPAATAVTKAAAGTIIVVPIYLSGQTTVNEMRINVVTTALGAAGDIGIYNSAGSLVINGGSSSLTTATGLKTIAPTQTGTARVLEAGQYYVAVTWNATTGSVSGAALPIAGLSKRTGTITGGGLVLPSTLTLSGIAAAANIPAVSINN